MTPRLRSILSLWNAQYLADYEGPLWPDWDRMREIIRKDDGRPVHAPPSVHVPDRAERRLLPV